MQPHGSQAAHDAAPDQPTPQQKKPVWTWTGAVAAADVPPLTKLVCLNIARYLSSAGKGWRLSIEQMMLDTGLSNRSLATHLQKAKEAGLLDIKRMPGSKGQRGVTLYRPRIPDGVELAREPAEMPGEGEPPSEGGSRGQREGGSPRQGSPREGGSRGPREGDSRQVPFHKEEPFQERGGANAPTPEEDDPSVAEVFHGSKQTRRRRSTTLTDAMEQGWSPGETGRHYAKQQGLTEQQTLAAFEKFKAHHLAKGSAMADWNAAWRTWVLREVEYATKASAAPGRGRSRFNVADYVS
jgi:hypothetical protein